MDPITALAALMPLGIEAGKYAIQRWLAPETVKPGTFAEFLQLRALELEQFKTMQGGDGGSYPWVAAVRQLQRPVFAAVVMATWVYQASGGEVSPTVANMAGAVGFYLFGDRTLFYVSKGKA
jgi:hypothetical protein